MHRPFFGNLPSGSDCSTTGVRHEGKSIEERDAAVERLREFLRVNYLTGAQAAQRIGVRTEALYA